ncbi:MAG TPA: hypothetical protein PLF17_09795, partial [Chitinophagaceae bacterium]|nr:hypothetical protein [Chitinophagaceae bacterium]
QENAAKFGLGPDVYGMIDNVNYEGETYYGYFTEIVWVLEDFDNIPQDFWKLMHHTFKEDRADLIGDLQSKTGFIFTDSHYANIGVKDGKLVCIDFDITDNCECIRYSEAL